MDAITLKINGLLYEGWKDMSVSRSIKAVSGSFSLSLTDQWDQRKEPWKIIPGDACVLKIGKDTVINGFVDDTRASFDRNSRTISVSGRDKSCDLVDCSAIHIPGNWNSVKLETLAKILCKPFGIGVVVEAETGAAFGWHLEPGEKAFESLDRAAKFKGILIYSNGDGAIVLARAAKKRSSTSLVQGKDGNVESASSEFSLRERYSKYYVENQLAPLANSEPGLSRNVRATVVDEGVKRYRPLKVTIDSSTEAISLTKRAQWEAAVRMGRSSKVNALVSSFRQKDGRLWQLNELVSMTLPWLGVTKQEYLVSSLTYALSPSAGETCSMELEPPQAFQLLPKVTKEIALRDLVNRESR